MWQICVQVGFKLEMPIFVIFSFVPPKLPSLSLTVATSSGKRETGCSPLIFISSMAPLPKWSFKESEGVTSHGFAALTHVNGTSRSNSESRLSLSRQVLIFEVEACCGHNSDRILSPPLFLNTLPVFVLRLNLRMASVHKHHKKRYKSGVGTSKCQIHIKLSVGGKHGPRDIWRDPVHTFSSFKQFSLPQFWVNN